MVALTNVPDAELEKYRQAIVNEQERRRTLANAAQQIDALARASLAARGITEGAPWVQPTDATNAYPKGWVVTHNDTTWSSDLSGNVGEPGVNGWREKPAE